MRVDVTLEKRVASYLFAYKNLIRILKRRDITFIFRYARQKSSLVEYKCY